MRRFSVLMAFILVLAFGLGALKNASVLWSGLLLLLTLSIIGFAVLGATTMEGRERHWWRGFSLFSGSYLALALGPLPGDTFQPFLGTTTLLSRLHESMHPDMVQTTENLATLQLERRDMAAQLERVLRVAPSRNDPAFRSLTESITHIDQKIDRLKTASTHEQFQRVGHCLSALLGGVLGGVMALWFYGRRVRSAPLA